MNTAMQGFGGGGGECFLNFRCAHDASSKCTSYADNHQLESPIPSGAQGGTFKYRTDVPGISRRNLYFQLNYLLSLFTSKKISSQFIC